MAKKPTSFIPPKGPHTEAPTAPKPVTIVITQQQTEGVTQRIAVTNSANAELMSFIAGVVAGHGYGGATMQGFDAAKRTLTFLPPPKAEA